MKLDFIDEPELEFASGNRHIDIRFGLMHLGPLDAANPRFRAISVGIIGTSEAIEGISTWLERCRGEIPAKASPYANLFPKFPGFRADTAFRSTLVLETRTQGVVQQKQVLPLVKAPPSNQTTEALVELFLAEMRNVVDKTRPQVTICVPPFEVLEALDKRRLQEDGTGQHLTEQARQPRYDFHDLLKARAMSLQVPVQLVWPHTYEPAKARRQRRRPDRLRGQQDEATRAWNLHTALYYKAGGIPWRLVRDPSQLTTCSVGVSFYDSLERDKLLTSMAQVFNERGDGVVVRGGSASISKDDRQPHLAGDDARALLATALATYRKEHRTLPARLVVHKTSRYSAAELAGFKSTAEAFGVADVDFISVGDSFIRVFRQASHPPLRGTLLSFNEQEHALYTRGSVNFFETYPGLYVPLPILFRREEAEQTPRFLATELMGLTKMNWNSTQFDGRDPITTRAARQVGAILRYIDLTGHMESRYGYYM